MCVNICRPAGLYSRSFTMQLSSGHAVGSASNFVVEPKGSTKLFPDMVVPVRAQSKNTDRQGIAQLMACKTILASQPSACAAPDYQNHLAGSYTGALKVAVAEFKGPVVHGLVHLIQVTKEVTSIEATFDGLQPGLHHWSLNEFGDLTRGPTSTGGPFNPDPKSAIVGQQKETAAGELGTLDADSRGHAKYSSTSNRLSVSDVIGRSIVVYQTVNHSDGIAAAVIARCAGQTVGQLRKTLCKCDGTVIWDSELGCVS